MIGVLKKDSKYVDLLICVMFFIIYYITIWRGGINQPIGKDLGDQFYAIISFVGKSISNGELPLWNPHIWGGYPTSSHLEVTNPLLMTLSVVFYDKQTGIVSFDAVIYYQIILLSLYTSFSYILLRTLKFDRIVSLVVVVLLTIVTSQFKFMGWLWFYGGIVYFPLLLTYVIKAFKNENLNNYRSTAMAGMVLGLIGLSIAAAPLLQAVLVISVIFLFYVWNNRMNKLIVKKIFARFIVIILIGLLIASASLVPFADFLSRAYRFVPGSNGTGEITLELFNEHNVGLDLINGIFRNTSRWFVLSPLALIFFVTGLFPFSSVKKPIYYASVFLFFASLIYSVGLFLPEIFYYIPYFNGIREPFLYVPIVNLMFVIISAYGLNKLLSIKKFDEFSGMYLLTIFLIFLLYIVPHNFGLVGYVNLLLVVLFFFTVLYNRSKQKKAKIATLLILIIASCLNVSDFANSTNIGLNSSEKVGNVNRNIESYNTIISEIADNDFYRLVNWGDQAYSSNMASLIGSYDVLAYSNPSYDKMWEFHKAIKINRRAQLQNIKYLVHRETGNVEFNSWLNKLGFDDFKTIEKLYTNFDNSEQSDVRLYKYPETLGSAWLVSDIIQYDDLTDKNVIFEYLNDPSIDLKQTALLNMDTKDNLDELGLNFEFDLNSEMNLVEYKNNSVTYEVTSNTKQILVTSDIYYPGWQVYVDGKKSDILELNYLFRGVEINEGTHIVEFKYIPIIVIVGLILSVLGLFTALLLIFKKDNYGTK